MPESAVGRLVVLEIGAVAHGGHCVARLDAVPDGRSGPVDGAHGRVVFVRHALPGELARVRITEDAGKSYCRGDAVEILRASPDRVVAPCEYAGPGRCGGCDWQHATPDRQRRLKADVVREQLARLAGLDRTVVVEELPGGYLGWRTRIHYAVDAGGAVGLRKHRSHQIQPIERCLIGADGVGNAGELVQRWSGANGLDIAVGDAPARGAYRGGGYPGGGYPGGGYPGGGYPGGEGPGGERPDMKIAGNGASSNGVAGGGAPSDGAASDGAAGGEVRDMTDAPEETQRTVSLIHPGAAPPADRGRGASGLRRARGPHPDHRAVLSGPATVTHEVDGHRFQVSATGFWQVHPHAAHTLAAAVSAFAAPRAGDTVLDLYAGAGLFSALLAREVGVTGSVVGLEGDRGAVADAAANLGPWPWAQVRRGAVTATAVAQLARVDIVVLDPPRSGAGREVMAAVLDRARRAVVYVACDPAALARDVGFARAAGWALTGLRAFDLFPMTQHVECVARLEPVSVT